MKFSFVVVLALLMLQCSVQAAEMPALVVDGQPHAEIVIAEQPTRMQRLAAHELRATLAKISGARLPIVTQPSGKAIKVFVGASSHCPIKSEGLQHGAYRMVSGDDWLALVGDDTDFVVPTPFARHNGDIPRAEAEWQQLTKSTWSLPSPGLYKHRIRIPGEVGLPDGTPVAKNEMFEFWGLDERGSFNAVCGFLHSLGARWYLPGELGEVLPTLKTIPLPKLNETVQPDFALRQFNFRFAVVGYETSLWAMRLGMRHDERLQIAHGMETMTGNDATFAAHPDWFALYGGKRHYTPGYSKNQLCYSNEELFRETVRYARASLDQYKLASVSIMPPDGYTAICQCERCNGKDTPERSDRGLLSDYVWDFVNRVAKEVAKTHPHGKILNCAYGVYTLPPLKIEKLEPNVLVAIVGGRRPINRANAKSEGEAAPEALRAAWAKKTDNPIFVFENYPFTDRGFYLPAFAAHSLVETVNATKGLSQGEDIWLTVRQDFDKVGIGFNHFQVYFTAKAHWGGKQTDADALLLEYCRLFYGPAEREMLEFFTYCEAHWSEMEDDKSKADFALSLFERAKAKADPASVHGRRMTLVDDYLKGLRMKSLQLAQKRGPVPTVRLVGDAKGIVIDGRLDDEYWQKCPAAATGRLRELQTGKQPIFGTTYKAGWQGNNVCFAIRCDERLGDKLNSTATRNGDQAIWYGDAIEIELATETHSYYQIAVSPSGAVVDLDRGAPRSQWFGWDAQAEVATHIADDHWTVEIRIPVTQDENDPLHQVVGRKPTQSLPWHINICRQRIREDGSEYSALSPTGTDGFHEPLKFAHFYDGRSHQFEADATVSDFVLGYRDALQKRDAKMFLALAEGKVTPFQKSAALEQAALFDKANDEAIIEQIPISAVQRSARMQQLLATYKAPEVIKQFADEDFSKWPFWKRGDGLHARGRAYFIMKSGELAERDLTAALEWTTEPRQRDALLLALAQNRELNLKDDSKAQDAFEAVLSDTTQIGGADEYSALLGIARIQTRRAEFAAALKTLERANIPKLTGIWREHFDKAVDAVKKAQSPK